MGDYYEPHVVNKILNSEGAVIGKYRTTYTETDGFSNHLQKIVELCNGAVANGTGKSARPAGYAIGGKPVLQKPFPVEKEIMLFPLWVMHLQMIQKLPFML